MTQDQQQQIKNMSWPDFFAKYGKMMIKGQITKAQYDKLVELKGKRDIINETIELL